MFNALALAMFATAYGVGQGNLPIVPIERTTRLVEVGFYRVSYQIKGKEVVNLGMGWTGHFEPIAGVSYTPWSHQDGVPTLLIHCPWRRGGGTAWVDYRFKLPPNVKAKFTFGCAMWRKSEVQKGSDGVTFAVFVNGVERFRKHIKSSHWEWHEIDLSEFAGKAFTLRLEVNAGPKNDASWDYSLWGDPKIAIEGARAEQRIPKVLKETLDGLSNDHRLGVRPSVHYQHRNTMRRISDRKFEFTYDGEDCKLRYIVEVRNGVFPAHVEVRLDDLQPFFAYASGYIEGEKGIAEVADVRVESFRNGKLSLAYTFRYDGRNYRGRSAMWLEGKTLFCEFSTDEGWAVRVNFGSPLAALRRSIFVPYLFATGVYYLPVQTAFASVFTDFMRSNASYLQGGAVTYERKTDGTRNPVHDICLFTVSFEFPEVLRNIPWEPSRYFDEIADRVVFDIWGGHLMRDAQWVRELHTYGITRAIMLKHVWQRYGYDSHLPTTVPANEKLGGDEGARALSDACRDAGWLFALHENYIDFYPLSHEWNPKEVALYPNGKMRKAWFNRGTGEQSYAYKNWAMAKYARKYSPEIHRRYRTTAAFYDVNSCAPPWLHLDCDANEPDAAMLRGRLKGNVELFKVAHDAHQGPLFGEGNAHFWWAGLVDGVEAQVVRKEWAPWLLDFDLLKIHVQQVNHGMGYWGRWQDDPEASWQGLPSPQKMDKYRAMEIAFGHAAFIPTSLWHALDWVLKEYYLTRPIQARYCASKVRRILYEVNGKLVTSSVALALDAPLERIFVEYESGLRLWVNAGERVWEVEGKHLPQFGFIAVANGLHAWMALEPDGEFAVDYCRDFTGKPTPFIFANGRAFPPSAGAVSEVKPLVEVKPIGGRKLRITYRFKVGRRNLEQITSRDLTVFVHFVNMEVSQRSDGIVFQHDHKPKVSTREWKPRSEVVDGPYDFSIPEGVPDARYEIRLGLYDKEGRVRILGNDDGSARYRVGAIIVKGERIEFEPIPTSEPKGVKGRVNFASKHVDFGEVVTAGMVIVMPYRDDAREGIRIIVHPRDESFEVGLRLERIARAFKLRDIRALITATHATVLDARGNTMKRIPLQRKGDVAFLRTVPQGAVYIIASNYSDSSGRG